MIVSLVPEKYLYKTFIPTRKIRLCATFRQKPVGGLCKTSHHLGVLLR